MRSFILLVSLAVFLGIQCQTACAEESITFQIRCFSISTGDIQQLEQKLEPLKKEYAALPDSLTPNNETEERSQTLLKQMDSIRQDYLDGCIPIFTKEFRTTTGVKYDFSIPFEGDTIRYRGIAGSSRSNTGEAIYDYPDKSNLWTSVDHTFIYGSYRSSHSGALSEGTDMIHILSGNSTQQLWAVIRAKMKK